MGFLRSLPANIMQIGQDMGLANTLVVLGLLASLVTPMFLAARRIDNR